MSSMPRALFRLRFLEEIAAASSKQEAEVILDGYKEELAALEPHAKEQVLAEAADLYAEKSD